MSQNQKMHNKEGNKHKSRSGEQITGAEKFIIKKKKTKLKYMSQESTMQFKGEKKHHI